MLIDLFVANRSAGLLRKNTVDMGEARDVDGFFFAQKNGDRKIKELEVQVSNDNGSWESIGLFGFANIDGE
ncbi:hypothetical protein H8S90_03455 [Olivibacter sp. SDN3]|uniref:discoidin domain-containing protein n=1 Tax=Olivibacter sp. SDN3 TaxID=2764720 RepID=UPI0016519FDF|nr:discoidin domain-containing protein [Olivibacter sp. SDN3]QNL50669.1 hypothetical protein H8S90_03455 [Olivibacter sp. SDN3]